MTERETTQFYTILEQVENDLASLARYSNIFDSVRSSANGALLYGDDLEYKRIMERIHYLCINIAQNLDTQEEILGEEVDRPRRANDRGDYT